MANALAVAAVTATLRDLLRDGLIDHEVAPVVGDVKVSVLAPDQVEQKLAPGSSQLNLFLYRVGTNPGWSNVGLPSRDSNGAVLTRPPLALDLQYLLTAHTDQDLHAELLLGYGMQVLHETPVLDREALRRALGPTTTNPPHVPVTGEPLPTEWRQLRAVELADQVEMVKVTPDPLGLEELSHLWSNLQAHYRPSAAYRVSVVLIESRRPARAAAPVRAVRSLVTPLRRPVIESVASRADPDDEPRVDRPIRTGDRLVLRGSQLGGGPVRVLVDARTVAADTATARTVAVTLPDDLPAGVHGVQVVHEVLLGDPPVAHGGAGSNVAIFVLRPAVVGQDPTRADDGRVTVPLTITPPVGRTQRLAVVLEQRPRPSPPIEATDVAVIVPVRDAAEPTTTFAIDAGPLPAGRYLLRVQVDGADSLTDGTDPAVEVP